MPRIPGHLGGDLNAAEISLPAFDSNDFPALGGQPMSRNGMGGVQGMLLQQDQMMMSGQEHYSAMAMHKQSIVGLHSEFSIETEDFPALGGGGPGEPKPSSANATSSEQQQQQAISDHNMDQSHPEQLHRRSMQAAHGGPMSAGGQMQMHPLNQHDHNAAARPLPPPSAQQQQAPRHPHQQIEEKQEAGFVETRVGSRPVQHMGQIPSSHFAPQPSQRHQEQGVGGAEDGLPLQRHPRGHMQQPGNGDAVPGGDAPGSKSGEDDMNKDVSVAAPGGSPPRAQPDSDGRSNDRFGLMGLLSVIQRKDQDLTTLALGMDLTSMGLSVNSPENLYKTFGSPWSDAPSRTADHDFVLPSCYMQPALRLQPSNFEKFTLETLFFVFYSMPYDESQLLAASELGSRGWFYHKDLKVWISRVANVEPTMKSDRSETGSFFVFDPAAWERIRKDNFTVEYDKIEQRTAAPQPPSQQRQQAPSVPVDVQQQPGQVAARSVADQPQ